MATAAFASVVPQLIHERFIIEPRASQARPHGLRLHPPYPFGQALAWFVACKRLWRALVFHGQSVAQCSTILKIKATNGVRRKPKVTRVASNERSDGREAVVRCVCSIFRAVSPKQPFKSRLSFHSSWQG